MGQNVRYENILLRHKYVCHSNIIDKLLVMHYIYRLSAEIEWSTCKKVIAKLHYNLVYEVQPA